MLPTSRKTRVAAACLSAAACVIAALAPAADARSTYHPAKATNIRIASATGSTMTVTTSRAAHTSKYMVYVSTLRSDLYYANMTRNRHSSHRHTATASGPRITVRGLAYTTKTYWYRVRTINGSKSAYSPSILAGGVKPSSPGSLSLHDNKGLYLTWSGQAGTGYVIKQATNSAMTSGVRYWRASGYTHQFTPYGIKAHKRYYFAVRTTNNGVTSGYSNHVSGTTSAREKNLRVMTYNVLSNVHDGHKQSGHTIAPWSKRGPAAAAAIKRVSPDVIAVQEAGNWIKGREYRTRQIDSLRSYLGSGYGLAHTEATYPERTRGEEYCQDEAAYCRAYSYIIYKKSTIATVGNGGHFRLSGSGTASKYAAYQNLQSRATGARFLMVSAHLFPGNGRAPGLRRQSETKVLVNRIQGIEDRTGLKAVYGGDFNTSYNPVYYNPDGPGIVMRASHVTDSRLVAQKHYNSYTSVNNLLSPVPRPYPTNAIDYVFTSPGVSAYSWGVSIRMSHGRMYGTIPSDHHPVFSNVVLHY